MSFRASLKKIFRGSLIIGALVSLLGLAAVAGTWWRIKLAVEGETATVPELLGLTTQEAREKVEGLNLIFTVDRGQKVFTNVIEKDRVYLQAPRAGRKIKTGREIEVTLSAGPEKKLIPDLEGETLSFSKTLLDDVKVASRIVSRTPSLAAGKGRVISQHPQPGKPIGLRPDASLLISDGPQAEWYVAPDLVGRDYPSVKAFLDRHGFRVVTKYKTADEGLGQLVLQQTPRAGYPVNKSQTLTLIVNKDF